MKIRPAEADLFHADGRTRRRTDRQTGITELIVAFRSCANAPENRPEIPQKDLDAFSSYSSN